MWPGARGCLTIQQAAYTQTRKQEEWGATEEPAAAESGPHSLRFQVWDVGFGV